MKFKHMINLLLVGGLMTILFTGCNKTITDKKDNIDSDLLKKYESTKDSSYERYENDICSLKYNNQEWEYTKVDDDNVILFNNKHDNETYSPYICITSSDNQPVLSLDEYIKAKTELLKTSEKNISEGDEFIISNEKTKINNIDAYMLYTKVKKTDTEYIKRFRIIFINEDKCYEVNFNALSDDFDNMINEVLEIIKSFNI